MDERVEGWVGGLWRHLVDLRDGRHGEGAVERGEKERVFEREVGLVDPHARAVLGELNQALLLGEGEIEASGVERRGNGDLAAAWRLTWREQREAGVPPVTVEAWFGAGFHHPHLHGATVGEWPLNAYDEGQAAAEVPTLRAIAVADLHNLVFRAGYRIVPALTR